LFIAILVGLCLEVYNEQYTISMDITTVDKVPLPNIYFSNEHNFIVECTLSNGTYIEQLYDCGDYVNNTIKRNSSDRPYFGAFLPNYNVTLETGCTTVDLNIFITDPAYNSSYQNFSLFMFAFDKEYDPYYHESSMPTFTPFEELLLLKNAYYLSRTILSLLGVIGGIWSSITGFYVFLFGLGLFSPWGFVQKSKPFKIQYEKNLLPFTVDSQPDKLDTEENASILKRLDNLEKSLQFYKEYVLDTSFLPSVKKNASLAIEK
ncbi:1750_t:CDS:2, partial [Cetraspora pellucida]